MTRLCHYLLMPIFLFACIQDRATGDDMYPTVDQLPAGKQLPDPFQFFGSDRRVKTREDWEQRQTEMMKMLQHYIYGPAFPQVYKYEVESRTEEQVSGSEIIKYTANLKIGPDANHPVTISYYLLPHREANSILIYVVAGEEPLDTDAIKIAKRGYGYAALTVGPYEKIARRISSGIEGTRTMAWVWGMNEMINYLTSEHRIDKVIITGCSRYGRVALLTGALIRLMTATASPAVTGTESSTSSGRSGFCHTDAEQSRGSSCSIMRSVVSGKPNAGGRFSLLT